MNRILKLGIAVALLTGLTGCQSLRPESVITAEPVFDYDGMPHNQYMVGGGYVIHYRAPVAGDLYIADNYSKKLLATVSLQKGQLHPFDYDMADNTVIQNMTACGINPASAAIKVYFVPRGQATTDMQH